MQELGIQTIAAYSPEARGRSERNFGTWQNRLPQQLRLAGISGVEAANRFLRERYIAEFNEKFSVAAPERGRAFRACSRKELDFIFSAQTERVVDKDNTVKIGERWWQIEKSRWRYSLARQTVTIHQHWNATVSIRCGPHVVGRYDAAGQPMAGDAKGKRGEKAGAWKPAKTQSRFSPAPPSLGNLAQTARFPTAPTAASSREAKTKTKKAAA